MIGGDRRVLAERGQHVRRRGDQAGHDDQSELGRATGKGVHYGPSIVVLVTPVVVASVIGGDVVGGRRSRRCCRWSLSG